MASATSLLLTIMASLRAASRLEERIVNRGSIGLMDGPPILGPPHVVINNIGEEQPHPRNQSSSSALVPLLQEEEEEHDGHSHPHPHYHQDGEECVSVVSSITNINEYDKIITMNTQQHDTNNNIGIADEIKFADKEEEEEVIVRMISPLWEHTEAFRRAAILGLVFDDLLVDDNNNNNNVKSKSTSSVGGAKLMFADVVQVDGKKFRNARGGDENDTESHDDLAMAVAVEAGLLSPPPPPSGSTARVRGGGGGAGGADSGLSKPYSFERRNAISNENNNKLLFDSDGSYLHSRSSNNPLIAMAYWFERELSAPLAVIPAWHKVLCTYWQEQKENQMKKSHWILLSPFQRLRFVLTGRSTAGRKKPYDASHLDFDASISGLVHIPCARSYTMDKNDDAKSNNGNHPAPMKAMRATSINNAVTTVRVKAYAPRTFRDLRNKCFRVTEGEYAKSILNGLNVATATRPLHIFFSDDGLTFDVEEIENNADESMVAQVLHNVLLSSERNNYYKSVRRREIQQQQQTTTTTTMPYISFQSNSKGAARAGTFFFFTADGAYMIKTVKKEEAKAFLHMLPEYHRFMSDGVNGRNSLLTRIFGMYSVRFPPSDGNDDALTSEMIGSRWDGGLFTSSQDYTLSSIRDDERIYLVMHSVFPPEASSFVTERFDLKGSTVGRECSQEERRSKGANAVLKDLDLKREVEEEVKRANRDGRDRKQTISRHGICIGRKSKMALMAQLERDIDLLCRCNVLDYSLLVGVVDMEVPNGSRQKKLSTVLVPKCIRNLFRWMDSPMPYYGAGTTKVDGGVFSSLRGTRKGKQVIYYLGVIDFLQPWTLKKRLERDLKGLAGYDKSAISCVAPTDYADRFLKFFDVHVT